MGEHASRRRGSTLEDAILDAAWEILGEQGYDGMTLAGVAKRAGTSRPVLHRRWPNRLKLAVAALARAHRTSPIEIPDLGSVADELKLLLRRMSDRWRPELVQIVFDMAADMRSADTTLRAMGEKITNDQNVRAILRRGESRGEIDPSRLSPRLVSLPTDLVRHELIMTMRPVPSEVIDQIVDQIFRPLACFTASKPSHAPKT